jgi:hypothetical protein
MLKWVFKLSFLSRSDFVQSNKFFSSLLLQVFFSYANLVWLHFYSYVREKKIVMYNVNAII